MEIRIKVDNINYDSIVKALLPLLNKNNGERDNKMKNKILSMFGGTVCFQNAFSNSSGVEKQYGYAFRK